jgi:putative oxygen-independent coproporphyrinogen III oxidase
VLKQPPLALYAHFPWCVQKCPYCDFNSYGLRESLPEERYVAALAADLEAQYPQVAGRPLVSVFFGGGTPSLFPPAAIGRVIEHIRAAFAAPPDLEITLEANPGTIERGRFAEYRAAGVTRVSVGAQSFSAQQLKSLGRIHAADDTRRAAEELHAAGLTNFNLDLMYGLPSQTPAEAEADVRQALALQPQHLSHYQLTIEPGTVFAGAPPELPDEESIDAMLDRCQAALYEDAFARYEVSAYSRAGRECQHNLNYWNFGDYLGLGAGAHGKITDVAAQLVRRTQQQREPRRYLALVPKAVSTSVVSASQLPFEFMLNALRLTQGFSATAFEERTGLLIVSIEATLEKLQARGLLEPRADGWRATENGFRFVNEALVEFLPTAPQERAVTP